MKRIMVGLLITILVIMLTACGDESAPEPHGLGNEGLIETITTEEIQVEEIRTEEIITETILTESIELG